MSLVLHKVLGIVVVAVMAGAPAWCFCAPQAAAQQVKKCCMHRDGERQSRGNDKQGPACPHCGTQLVKAAVEVVQVADLSQGLAVYACVPIALNDAAQLSAAVAIADESPPGSINPVTFHFISLT